jgi:hypothetical protein
MRSREALANWLLCVCVNHACGEDRLTFTSDPDGGDGIIFDRVTGETVRTERVYIPGPGAGGKQAPAGNVEALMLKAIAKKQPRAAPLMPQARRSSFSPTPWGHGLRTRSPGSCRGRSISRRCGSLPCRAWRKATFNWKDLRLKKVAVLSRVLIAAKEVSAA